MSSTEESVRSSHRWRRLFITVMNHRAEVFFTRMLEKCVGKNAILRSLKRSFWRLSGFSENVTVCIPFPFVPFCLASSFVFVCATSSPEETADNWQTELFLAGLFLNVSR